MDNIYWGMVFKYAKEPIDDNINLFEKIIENEKQKGNEVSKVFAFADFSQLGSKEFKLALELQSVEQVYVSSVNNFLAIKNASDLELSIRAVDYTYTNPEVERYVIVSGDSDMIPVIKYLRRKGNSLIYPSYEMFVCNIMKYLKKPDRTRLSKQNAEQIIEKCDKEGILRIEYSKKLKMNMITADYSNTKFIYIINDK